MKIPHIKIKPPGPKAKAIVEKDQRYTAPAYGRVYPLVVKEGRGMVIEDVDGNLFLDFMAGIAVASTGHSHPKVVKAIEEQARKFLHICGSDFYYEPMAELAEKLSRIAPGRSPKKVFLTNSGTETIEAAFKLARFATKRNHVIAFLGAFHGRTMGALSLTASRSSHRAHFSPLIPDIHHAPYGQANYLEQVLFRYEVTPEEVAAIFVEPILGEGGYVVPPPEFLPRLKRAVPTPRHTLGHGRDSIGIRAHRQDVCVRALGHRARYSLCRQGNRQRHAARGDDCTRRNQHMDTQHSRLDLRRESGGLRGGARHHQSDRRRVNRECRGRRETILKRV